MPETLDSGVRKFLRSLDELEFRPLAQLTPDQARAQFRQLVALGQGPTAELRVGRVSDATFRGIPVRIYEPAKNSANVVVLYIHGGGWVLGDLDTTDSTARALAESLGYTVITVGYRLAPEYPYPAALDDCRAVAEHLNVHYPKSRIALAGDSAGGNLALAVSAISTVDHSIRVDAQLLIYPALDEKQQHPSQQEFAEGYLLTKEDMHWFWEQYLGPHRETPQSINALEPTLGLMPTTIITTAGFDPLQDEGKELARRLAGAGVPVHHLHHSALPHGWLDFAGTVPAAAAARAEVIGGLSDLLDRLPVTGQELVQPARPE